MNIFKKIYNHFYMYKHNKIDVTDISKKTTKVRIIGDNNTVSILNKTKKNPKIIVKIDGYNNQVIIDDLNQEFTGKLYIYIWGNNSSVKIGKNFSLGLNLSINLGDSSARDFKIDNVHCKIGENCRFEDVFIQTDNSNNTISIGDNCLFSSDVNLYNTDSHPIFDKTTGKLINCVNDMKIGNSCWLGKGCSILKGVTVPNGTIVGWKSVVSKSIDKEYCAVAGVPAKIVKENVTWDKFASREYIDNKKVF